MKNTLLPLIFILCTFLAKAQTIAIVDKAVVKGPYGRGSIISVPFKLDGPCFDINNNEFHLVLSDEKGVFTTNSPIINTPRASFFLTYLNGTIPGYINKASTNYKVRIESTAPYAKSNEVAIEIKDVTYSPDIKVTLLGVNGNTNPTPINDTIFGTANGNRNIPNQKLDFGLPSYSASAMSSFYTNTINGTVTDLNIDATGGFNITMALGSYYPLTVVHKDAAGYVSAKSFLLLHNTPVATLSNDQGQYFCNPDSTSYTVDTSGITGIGKNYPGSYYNIYWGDNTTERYTHCQLLQNNKISHNYSMASCRSPFATNNLYQLTMYLFSPEGQNFKDFLGNNPLGRNTSAIYVAKQPKAVINAPEYACINKELLIMDASKGGDFPDVNNAGCLKLVKYTWYVDGKQVHPATPNGPQNWPGWPNFYYTFTTLGKHTIKLYAQNDDVNNPNCFGDTVSQLICVEPPRTDLPAPKFTYTITDANGSSTNNCGPVTIKAISIPVVSFCRTLPVNWSVLDSARKFTVPTSDYSISDYQSQTPTIIIHKPGKYYIQLVDSNSCDKGKYELPVNVVGKPSVQLPPDKVYCGVKDTIYFDTTGRDPDHAPKFISYGDPATESHGWNLFRVDNNGNLIRLSPLDTPADAAYADFPDGDGDKYTKIIFKQLGKYAVVHRYTGACENAIDTQYITFTLPTSFKATAAKTTICSGEGVNISLSPSNLTYAWSATPSTTGVTGAKAQVNDTSIAVIQQLLRNSDNSAATVTYKIRSGGCLNDTSIIINVSAGPTTPNAGPDQAFCNTASSALLTANTVASGTATWKQILPASFIVPNPTPSNPSLTVPAFAAGDSIKMIWEVKSPTPGCPSYEDTVTVYNYKSLTNLIDDAPRDACFGQSITVTQKTLTGGSGNYAFVWQKSKDKSKWEVITNSIARLDSVSFNADSTTTYVRRLITAGPCSDSGNIATINVKAPITQNTISPPNQLICANTKPAILLGSNPVGADNVFSYNWESSIDTGKTWIAIGLNSNQKDYTPTPPPVTTLYRRVVTSNLCQSIGSFSNADTIRVIQGAVARFNYARDVSCAPFNLSDTIKLVPNSNNKTYEWFADGVSLGFNSNGLPAYSITKSFDSVTIKLKATSNNSCNDDSISHKFYTTPQILPAFVASNDNGCGPLTVGLTNNTPNKNLFTYVWNFGTGNTSTFADPGNIIFPTSPLNTDTVYNVVLSASTSCETVSVNKGILVKAKPRALFSPDKSFGCSPFTVTFNNTTKGSNVSYKWSWGDGNTFATGSDTSVKHTFITNKSDTFKVKLTATNNCGVDSLNYNILVSPSTIKLDFAVNGNEALTCNPGDVHFINNTSGASDFDWDFGDGNFLHTLKNIDTVLHTYTTPGIFTVKLRATNGCSDTTDTEMVRAFVTPVAKFTIPASACLGDSVRFINEINVPAGYTWNYGDGNTSKLTQPSHAYKVPGQYMTSLIAITQHPGKSCGDTLSIPINIFSKAAGAFNASQTVSVCVPFNAVFTNLSVPAVTTAWDFGDNKKDTGDIVQHTFTQTGTYNVKMNAYKAGGCNYEAIKVITVNGPTGSWQYDNGLICNTKAVRFEANTIGTDSIRIYFGDGTFETSTNSIIFHTYKQSGIYIPSLELFSGATCRTTIQGKDTIKLDNLLAGFTTTAQKVCDATTIQFIDTSRAYFGIQSWQWNFGDGSSVSRVQNPSHTYYADNSYPVELIVTGKSGCTSGPINIPVPVSINTKPKPVISTGSYGCVNQSVQYTANVTSKDAVNFYKWVYYDNSSALGQTASKIYTTDASYTTKLIVGTVNGCYDTVFSSININPSPDVFASPDKTVCAGQTTQLSASGADNYTWSPLQNISCVTCTNPVVSPTVTSQFVVTTYNSYGCSASDTVVVNVKQKFTMQVSASDSICLGQSTRLFASGAEKYEWFPATGLSDAKASSPLATPTITTNYMVTGKDSANCFTDVAYINIAVGNIPVLNLGKDQVIAAGAEFKIVPTLLNGPVKSWLWTPSIAISSVTSPEPTITAKNDICYIANATTIYNCTVTDTLCFKVFCRGAQVYIPNAFMPGPDNATGANKIFMVRGTGIKQVKSFRVYNRWGQVVFEKANIAANNPNFGWDGTIQGKLASPDIYVYTCEAVCENGVVFTYKGNVALMK